jgi:hypothetical protein
MTRTVRNETTKRGAGRGRTALVGSALAVGLLLWARLIVITDMPRTAIADDELPGAMIKSSDKDPAAPRAALPDVAPNRDPFAVSDAHFPDDSRISDFAAEPEKSAAQVTEDRP